MQVMNLIKTVNHVLMTIIKYALILFGTAMTVLVILNVILRYVFNSGLTWSEEASRFLFIWTTFMGAILANDVGIHGEHMRMDFIVEKFRGVPRKVVELVAMLLVLALLVLLFIGSLELVMSTWAFKTSALQLPRGLVYMCAPISFGYMALQTVAKLVMICKASDAELNHEEDKKEEVV